jgi:hypothetical protein
MTIIHVQGDGKNIDIPCGEGKFEKLVAELGFAKLKDYKADGKNVAGHNDKGATQKVAASEIFVLIEDPGYGSFMYKTVANQEEGEAVAQKIMDSAWTPVGLQVFIAGDLMCYRKVFSDQLTTAGGGSDGTTQ